MLNAGYSNLEYLKRQIFPDVMEDDVEWDEDLKRIALAVAVQFGRYCNRAFDRVEDAVHEESANRGGIVLHHYPVESTSHVQRVCADGADDLPDAIAVIGLKSGIVEFNYIIGTYKERIRMTYTGGYWLDDGTVMPDGATPLPADILNAFVMQVQAVVKATDVLRNVSVKAEDEVMELAALKLLPIVEQTLEPYRRFA